MQSADERAAMQAKSKVLINHNVSRYLVWRIWHLISTSDGRLKEVDNVGTLALQMPVIIYRKLINKRSNLKAFFLQNCPVA